jgi:hypothetical protein
LPGDLGRAAKAVEQRRGDRGEQRPQRRLEQIDDRGVLEVERRAEAQRREAIGDRDRDPVIGGGDPVARGADVGAAVQQVGGDTDPGQRRQLRQRRPGRGGAGQRRLAREDRELMAQHRLGGVDLRQLRPGRDQLLLLLEQLDRRAQAATKAQVDQLEPGLVELDLGGDQLAPGLLVGDVKPGLGDLGGQAHRRRLELIPGGEGVAGGAARLVGPLEEHVDLVAGRERGAVGRELEGLRRRRRREPVDELGAVGLGRQIEHREAPGPGGARRGLGLVEPRPGALEAEVAGERPVDQSGEFRVVEVLPPAVRQRRVAADREALGERDRRLGVLGHLVRRAGQKQGGDQGKSSHLLSGKRPRVNRSMKPGTRASRRTM